MPGCCRCATTSISRPSTCVHTRRRSSGPLTAETPHATVTTAAAAAAAAAGRGKQHSRPRLAGVHCEREGHGPGCIQAPLCPNGWHPLPNSHRCERAPRLPSLWARYAPRVCTTRSARHCLEHPSATPFRSAVFCRGSAASATPRLSVWFFLINFFFAALAW